MVPRQDILCNMVAYVGALDIPPYAYRPRGVARVEISYPYRPCEPAYNDIMRCNGMDILRVFKFI